MNPLLFDLRGKAHLSASIICDPVEWASAISHGLLYFEPIGYPPRSRGAVSLRQRIRSILSLSSLRALWCAKRIVRNIASLFDAMHAAPAADARRLHSSIMSWKTSRSSMRSASWNLFHRFSSCSSTVRYEGIVLPISGSL